MKKISKVLSLLLAVLMMFSVISISAAADTDSVKYHKNEGTTTATLYAADGTELAQDTVELTALAAEVPEEPTEPDEPAKPGTFKRIIAFLGRLIGIVLNFIG